MTAAEIPDEAPQERKPRKSAAAARLAEAKGFVDMEINGVALRVPTGENVPLTAILRFRGYDDKLDPLPEGSDYNLLGSRELLGPDQWKAFIGSRPTWRDFKEIGDKLSELVGNS